MNGERHGKGKEYNWDGKLLFEGEYKKRKRNGKGKQYFHNFYNSKFYFEGEYLNDKELIGTRYNKNGEIIYKLNNNINRRQIEYYENGQLKFEGEYLNGKRNGKGKEYSYDGNLIFEGEYKNDKKWNGKGYNSLNNIIYELKEGKGLIKEYDYNGKLTILRYI